MSTNFRTLFSSILLGFCLHSNAQSHCDSLQLDTLFLNEITAKYKIQYDASKTKITSDSTIKITKKLKQVSTFALGNKLNRFYYKKKLIVEVQYFDFDNKCLIAFITRYDLDGKMISLVVYNHI